MKKRINSIDFFRGITAISVIMIHTVFHSGDNYVPANVQGWFLLIDIPIFMYLSGLLYASKVSPQKKMTEIGHLIKKWFIFCIICYIYLMIVDKNNVFYKDFISWLVFNPTTNSTFIISIKASLSFMNYYIIAGTICSIIIYFIKMNSKEIDFFKNVFYLLLFMCFMLLTVNVSGYTYFGLNSISIGYCIFFLVGFLSSKFKFKNLKHFLLLEILLNLIIFELFKIQNYSIIDLQNLKGSMNYLYVLVSLNSIFIIIFLKDRFNFSQKVFKPINFVGKNAFYMYFAQGISSSLLFMIEPEINITNLTFKILTMFFINLSMAILFFILLIIIYKLIDLVIIKLKKIIKSEKLLTK